MINELIEKIKGPKKLSFDHWRYKTLHWAFGINPSCKFVSPLPQSFYTHYCPLFHLTNLIVIFSPFIMMFKLAKAFLKGTLVCFDTIKYLLFKLFKRKEKVEKPLTEAEVLVLKRELAFDQIKEYVETEISRDGALEIFRIRNYKDFISDEEFFTCYDKHTKKLRNNESKKAEKDKILSNVFIFGSISHHLAESF